MSRLQVLCPLGLIELDDGVSCGCEAGAYLETLSGEVQTGEGTCKRCVQGKYAARGQRECLSRGRR